LLFNKVLGSNNSAHWLQLCSPLTRTKARVLALIHSDPNERPERNREQLLFGSVSTRTQEAPLDANLQSPVWHERLSADCSFSRESLLTESRTLQRCRPFWRFKANCRPATKTNRRAIVKLQNCCHSAPASRSC
jgi:hypothetical protein